MISCFGEILLRLSPDLSTKKASLYVGGAETNVCTALGIWNVPVNLITRLPKNELADSVLQYLGRHNISDSNINLQGERIGTYYLNQGSDLKHAGVVYDRNFSAFSNWESGQTDWESLLQGSKWFHWSAITPALNHNLALVCAEAITAAKKLGLYISVDLNYRSKLWQYGKLPTEIMPELVQHCDLIMGNIWAANSMLGVPLLREGYHAAIDVAECVFESYKQCKRIAFTFRNSDENSQSLFATLSTRNHHFLSNTYRSNQVVDRVGSGDAFMAGLIYGYQQKWWGEYDVINFAAASAYCKWHIPGDHTTATVKQIMKTIKQSNETDIY